MHYCLQHSSYELNANMHRNRRNEYDTNIFNNPWPLANVFIYHFIQTTFIIHVHRVGIYRKIHHILVENMMDSLKNIEHGFRSHHGTDCVLVSLQSAYALSAERKASNVLCYVVALQHVACI